MPGGPLEPDRAARLLVVTDHTGTTPELIDAMTRRAALGAVQFRILVPNPARAEMHLVHPERHDKAEAAERVLLEALPAFEAAAGGRIHASVSIRHDPFEAVEELMLSEPVDEILLSISAHEAHRWLHPDLEHRLQRLGVPVQKVTAST